MNQQQQPSAAFIGVSWISLITGILAYNVGLFNSTLMMNEKGYYFVVLMYGLFAAVTVQKSVRDKMEDIPVSSIFFAISWFSSILAVLLLIIGLWNSTVLTFSEKGFYGISFILSLFSAITVQKNTRDSMNK